MLEGRIAICNFLKVKTFLFFSYLYLINLHQRRLNNEQNSYVIHGSCNASNNFFCTNVGGHLALNFGTTIGEDNEDVPWA